MCSEWFLKHAEDLFPLEFPTGGICYPRGSHTSAPHRQQGNVSGATTETVSISQSLHLPKCISNMKTAKITIIFHCCVKSRMLAWLPKRSSGKQPLHWQENSWREGLTLSSLPSLRYTGKCSTGTVSVLV